MMLWEDQLQRLHPPNGTRVRLAHPTSQGAEVQLAQGGKAAQRLSLSVEFGLPEPKIIVIYLTDVFIENAEAGELRGVDPQVSEMAGLQAPVKAQLSV